MDCDYYIQSELVIEYINLTGVLSKTRTNRILKKGYLCGIESDSNDDEETKQRKYNEEILKIIQRNTYKKILYENHTWIKYSYEKRYSKDLKYLCPNISKVIKIYKEYTAW